MFFSRQPNFSARSSLYRYVYFLISGFTVTSYSAWKREGEPNPFVPVVARARQTHRQEIVDIFDDSLRRR